MNNKLAASFLLFEMWRSGLRADIAMSGHSTSLKAQWEICADWQLPLLNVVSWHIGCCPGLLWLSLTAGSIRELTGLSLIAYCVSPGG